MTYDALRNTFIILAVLSGIFFAVSVFLFIRFKIQKVIGYLTGVTAQKQIRKISERQLSMSNTEQISDRQIMAQTSADVTQVLTQSNSEATVILQQAAATVLLSDNHINEKLFEVEYDITYIHTNEIIV